MSPVATPTAAETSPVVASQIRVSRLERFVTPQALIRLVLYLTILIYLRTIFFDFAYDDVPLILLNPWMASWKSVPAFFTHSFWGFAEFPRPTDYYRPLVMTFLAVLHHTLVVPAWFHLAVLAVHVAVIYLAYQVTRELTGDGTMAAIAAGIFGLHPTKIESVAWISGISDSLCMVFFLGSILVYLRWKNRDSIGHVPVLSVLLLLLAMLSKEMAVVVPVLIALYELLTTQGGFWEKVKSGITRSLPYAVVVAMALGLRVYAMRDFSGGLGYKFRLSYSIYSAPQAILWYLSKQVWPLPVSLQYPLLTVTQPTFLLFFMPLAGVALLAICLAVLLRKSVAGWFLVAWFVLTLAPVLAFGAVLQLHDRHMYTPSFATSVALAYVIVTFARRHKASANMRLATVVSMVCVALALMTTLELRYWRDEITLFERVVAIAPQRVDAYSALAGAYLDRKDLDNAERTGLRWTQNTPDPMGGWLIVGEVRRERRDLSGARQAFEQGFHVAKSPLAVGFAAQALGAVAMDDGKPAEAARWYKEAIQGQPNAPMLHDYYGRALIQLGEKEKGEHELQIAQKLRHRQAW